MKEKLKWACFYVSASEHATKFVKIGSNNTAAENCDA